MKVHELMSTEVVTASTEMNLKEVARLMLGHQISGVPIIDDDQRLIGIVTEADIIHQESLRAGGDRLGILKPAPGNNDTTPTTAGEAMSGHVVTTAPEVDHTVAARLMETRGVKRLPVVDVDGRVVGIISRSDIMTSFARPDELIEDEIQVDILDRILWTEPGAITVEVVDGRVTLHGLVPKKSDSRILEELSKRLDGVVEVNVDDVYYTIDDTRAGQASGGAPLALW
jgi:CBS domain-containing protein